MQGRDADRAHSKLWGYGEKKLVILRISCFCFLIHCRANFSIGNNPNPVMKPLSCSPEKHLVLHKLVTTLKFFNWLSDYASVMLRTHWTVLNNSLAASHTQWPRASYRAFFPPQQDEGFHCHSVLSVTLFRNQVREKLGEESTAYAGWAESFHMKTSNWSTSVWGFFIIKTRFALAGKLIYCSDNSKHIYLSLLLLAFMFSVTPVCLLSPLQTMTCFIVTRSKRLNTRSVISTVLFHSFSLQHRSLFCTATAGCLSKILEKQLL